MTKECPGCKEAEKGNPAIFYMDCLQCDARALATSPEAKDAMLGHPQGLQAGMRKLFPNPERYRQGRIATYEWIKKLG